VKLAMSSSDTQTFTPAGSSWMRIKRFTYDTSK
jgi:hypothetical protein